MKKIFILFTLFFGTQNLSADANLTTAQLHAVMGIITNFILSDTDTTAPVFTSSAAVSVSENQTDAIVLSTTDASGVTYSISGTDAGLFTVDTQTGVVTFNTAPDYETRTSYTFTATATDVLGNVSTQSVTITIIKADTLGYSDITLRDTNMTADFYTPAPMSELLQESRPVIWKTFTSPSDLKHFAFGQSINIVVLSDTNTTVNEELTISAALSESSSVSNDLLLKSMFEFVKINTGSNTLSTGYAIFSLKHPNYALDVADNGTDLILRDVRSYEAFTGAKAGTATVKMLTFDYTASKLVVNARYELDSSTTNNSTATYTDNDDRSIVYKTTTLPSTTQVTVASGSLSLTTTGTTLRLYDAPIGLEIPFDTNPKESQRVSNMEVYLSDAHEGDNFGLITQNIMSVYAAQVSQQGSDASTTAAASALIDTIKTTLAAQGSQLRYPKEFYLNLRAGFFKRVLITSESLDGVMGGLTVPYVFFTNESDADGNYHPFMVIATHGLPDTLALLRDVPRPPADGVEVNGSILSYPNANVTRNFYMENFTLKIPMRDYGEVGSVTENDLSAIGNLADDEGETNYDHHNYASKGETAVAIDGVIIFPSYNNTLNFAQEFSELSNIGMHSGRGLGVHYHMDAQSAAASDTTDETDTGLGLYNESDYVGHAHPPIISIGFDGIAGYGYYLQGDTTSDGVNIALDDFGGHEHGDYGYHYHSFRTDRTVKNGGQAYVTHELPSLGAWAGRINKVPEFEARINRSKYTGNPQ